MLLRTDIDAVPTDPNFIPFPSRRSVVHSINGIVACTQPLAAEAGQRILRAGGNAADAAVAMAAAMNMTEPSSTGIGGDMFCLFYDAKSKTVHGLNGSGKTGSNASLDGVRSDLKLTQGVDGIIPMNNIHAVTIPGAAAGWVDTFKIFGSGNLSLEDILTPAIELGENGFPVSELSASFWSKGEKALRVASPTTSGELLKHDDHATDKKRAPRTGELFYNPTLANTFRLLAKDFKKGFYEGAVAEALIKAVQAKGSYLTLDDLKRYGESGSHEVNPISLKFNGQNLGDEGEIEIWEHPPNGQGIVALMALGILQVLEQTGKIPTFRKDQHNSPEYLHAVIESLRIAFADATWWVADPAKAKIPTEELISAKYLAERAKLFDPSRASDILNHESPAHGQCDTVYFAVTDKLGNGMSFINSNYGSFGSGIIPEGCGFSLQNRGANFSLQADHPNVFAPGKRPYHTIIPAMVTNPKDHSLNTVFGVMGGFMQPQGHVQVLLNMLAFKYNPQVALDAPRICLAAGTAAQGKKLDQKVYVEEGIGDDVVQALKLLGHTDIEIVRGRARGLFGRGQIIRCHTEDDKQIYSAGSDPRGDGAAFPA